MPFDPSGFIENVWHNLPKVPSAIIAAALLGGPTLIWLIARFTHPPDPLKVPDVVPEDPLWLCTSCRSMNEDRVDRCYRCRQPRVAENVPVVAQPERAPALRTAAAPPLRPVMPPEQPLPASWLGGDFAALFLPAENPVDPKAATEQPALPPALEPQIVEPRVKGSGRSADPGPARPRTRRKPQGAGDANSKRNSRTPGS
jgi:hypothetical protein